MMRALARLFGRARARAGDDGDGDDGADASDARARARGARTRARGRKRRRTRAGDDGANDAPDARDAFARWVLDLSRARSARAIEVRARASEAAIERDRRAEADATVEETVEETVEATRARVAYSEDDRRGAKALLEVAREAFEDGERDEGRAGAREMRGYGLRFTRDAARGETVLELRGPRQLITAQSCARTPALAELARYWLLVQSSAAVRTLVSRQELRQWRRTRRARALAPWAKKEDFEGDGYVIDPTSEQLHLTLDETLLCCFLALEKKKGKSSSHYEYLSKLPTLEEYQAFIPAYLPMPYFVNLFGYGESKAAYGYEPRCNADLRWLILERHRIERAVELTYSQIVSQVTYGNSSSRVPTGSRGNEITAGEFRWAYAVVMSRSFQSPNPVSNDPWRDMFRRMDFCGIFMAPGMDFANHKRPREVSYVSSDGFNGNGQVTMKALRNFKAGEFLHITYGAKGNTDLLLRYGFCFKENVEPDGSSNDRFRVDKDDFRRFVCGADDEGAVKHQEIMLQLATTADYTYKPFVELLDVARAHFVEAEPILLADREDAAPTRDDDVWDQEEDVFAANGTDTEDEEEYVAMYGADEESLKTDSYDGDVVSRDKHSARLRVETKALRALSEYLSTLQLVEPPEHADALALGKADVRELTSYSHLRELARIWRASRRRTLDVYALAAHTRAESLLRDFVSADTRRGPSSPTARAELTPTRAQLLASRALVARLADAADARVAADALATARARVFRATALWDSARELHGHP